MATTSRTDGECVGLVQIVGEQNGGVQVRVWCMVTQKCDKRVCCLANPLPDVA